MSLFQFAYYLWSDALCLQHTRILTATGQHDSVTTGNSAPDFPAAFVITEVYGYVVSLIREEEKKLFYSLNTSPLHPHDTTPPGRLQL